MSDFEDQTRNHLSGEIAQAYRTLATISENLPIGITLPAPVGTELVLTDAIPAVRRAMILIEEQPLPEAPKDLYVNACCYWLSAVDVFTMLVVNGFHSARALSIARVLEDGDTARRELSTWLTDRWLEENDQ
ncbi:hypothetical protein [Streptomyces sp. AM 2-1-1]|uniref:hypothetical protein n=1 Tax=Streptomyces sp. AM 2-1-1 TaxID=3028709 RepID=UPI0023B8DC31|nr:hypothetical protein [Streptomyces sp. AM 2-1-1]WEH40783.1 hypothetical protein PZB77_15435 [Streptomyces sp. AM 2-1-1]